MTAAKRPALLEKDARGRQVIWRLESGTRGTGRVLYALRDRGYGPTACILEMDRFARAHGFEIVITGDAGG